MTIAFLFPGQGSQRPGMLHALPNGPVARRIAVEAAAILDAHGRPGPLDTEAVLRDTTNAQLALLIAGVAWAQSLVADQDVIPTFVAGHSAGAFAAAVTAGVLTLAEAIATVAVRGDRMRDACARGRWGMAAIDGLTSSATRHLVERVSTAQDPLWLANVNSATELVVAGTTGALVRARGVCRDLGARDFAVLDVAVASHGAIQNGTAAMLSTRLSHIPRRAPTAHYLTSTGGRRVDTADAILDDLAHSVARPVRWYDATRLLAELGATHAVELGPGHVLTKLLAATAPEVDGITADGLPAASVAAHLRGRVVGGQ